MKTKFYYIIPLIVVSITAINDVVTVGAVEDIVAVSAVDSHRFTP